MDENTKAELYKMYTKAMKMMPGSSQQKELVKKIGALRKKLGMNEERDYKAEYKKFQSSTKSKKYRAELNKYNRKKGTYGNGDGKDASHKGGKIVGFESQSKNRGRAEKSRLKQESTLNENPAAIAAATAMTKIKMKNPKTGKENSAVSALKDKDNPNHKKAKGIFAKLKDRFSKKKDDKKAAPTKQTKSDADFYKRQYTGESVNEAKKPRYTKDGKRIISKSVWKRMPDYAKLRKNGVEHMLTGDPEKKGRSKYVPVQIESVNEVQKRQATDIAVKFDKAYLNFSREIRDIIKMVVKITGNRTDGKIFEKSYTKHLIPFDALFKSWYKGQQNNPHIKESVNEAFGDLNDSGFEKVRKYNKIVIKLVKKLENAVRHSEGKDAVKWIRGLYDAAGIMYDTIGHKMYYESDLGLTYKKGKTVKVKHKTSGKELVIIDKPNVIKKYEKLGFYAESVNEAKSKTMKTIGSIIGKKQAQKISGVLVDMQTALVIMKVWNALNKSNRSKFEKLPIKRMATVAWKLMK